MKYYKTIYKFTILCFLFLTVFVTAFELSSKAHSQETKFGTTTPELNEMQRLLASDGNADDIFGNSVDIDGDTAIVGAIQDDVGANTNEGSAYIFVESGGTWTEQAMLNAPSGDANDEFGTYVAVDGDTAIVGARFDDVLNSSDDKGAVYVYVRIGTTWSFQQKLTVSFPGTFPQDQLGHGVSLDGDRIVAGAPRENGDRGAAYVFVRNSGVWSEEQKLVPSETISPGDQFGYRTAISGNTLAVSAPTNSFIGEVFVFVFNGTTWVEEQKLTPSDGANEDVFGRGLAIEGDTIVVGSHLDHIGTNEDQGSAYVFTRSGTTWTEQQKLTASDGAANDSFGFSVSISGDRIVAGSRGHDFSPDSDQGTAYVFKKSGATWSEEKKLVATDKEIGDGFGGSVAIDGINVIAGAALKDISTSISSKRKSNKESSQLAGTNQGAAYIFDVLSGVSCYPVQPDLVSWWTGDGNTLDVRSRNDGTLNNGATYGTGKVGQGFSLDGVDDFVSTPDTPNLNFGTGAFSIETWVNFNSLAGEQILVEKYIETLNTNSTGVTFAKITSNRFLLAFTGGGTVVSGSQPLAINTWYHVVATRDAAGTVEIYLDGVSIVTGTNSANVDSTSSLKVGHRGNPTNTPGSNDTRGFYLNGLIDETSIYGRGLSNTEILAIYNADERGKCKPTAIVKPSGLVGWWAGDGDANDVDGNENGTLQNGAGFAVSKVGQGFKFDGVDDHVSIPDSPANSVSTAITIEAWVKPNTLTQRQAVLTKYNSDVLDISYFFEVKAEGAIRFYLDQHGDNTVSRGGDTIATIPINVYSHIAGTFDTATQEMKVYINGVEFPLVFTTSENITSIYDGVAPVRIGAVNFASPPPVEALFDGEIDEVALYNRALTATEIKSVFDAGLAGKLKSVNTNATAPPFSEFAEKLSKSIGQTDAGSSVVSEVGDATITFNSVTSSGTTQQIPFDLNDMPALPSGIITGLQYDIATSATYTGDVDICFNLPAFTTSIDFAGLRVVHLENNVWTNRTTTTDFATRTLCSNVTSLSPFAIIKFAPTAANVSISGKVLTANGRAIPRAIVSVADQSGNVRTATSNHFGNYSFENVSGGEIYTFTVLRKQYQFVPQVVNVSESITNLNLIAN